MVLTGYAWWFERYAPDEDQLREAQEAAREKKLGLWAESDGCAALGVEEAVAYFPLSRRTICKLYRDRCLLLVS